MKVSNKYFIFRSILTVIMIMSCTADTKNSTQLLNTNEKSALATEKPSSVLCENKNTNKKLSRKRRYVSFPEGSSFSVAVCFTIGIYGNPNYQFISWALNWGIAYDLPNETWAAQNRLRRDLPKPFVQRENRRDLYQKVELAMNDMGYNGRECILRAICETSQYFKGKGTNLVEELLRTIFSMPKTKVLPFEHKDLHHYDGAFRRGKSKSECSSFYPNCGFSLLDLAMGRYSRPENIQEFNFMK